MPTTPAQLPASVTEFTPSAKRMLAASVIAQLVGGTMAIGLFPLVMMSVSADLGWSSTQTGAMAGLTLLFAAIGLPVWGYLVDRVGARPVVLTGAALTGLGLFALSLQTRNPIQSGLTYAAIGFLSATSVAHVKAQALRFRKSRGVVLAILGMTVGISFGLTPLVGKVVLDTHGWRAVYFAFAALPLLLSLPVSFFWFRPEGTKGHAVDLFGGGSEGVPFNAALRTGRFWGIVAMAAASAFVFAGMQSNFVAFLGERGLSSQQAVNVLSIAVFGGLACQLLTGWMLDRWQTPRAAIPFVGIAILGMVMLTVSKAPASSISGVILLQSGVGGELSIIPYLVSQAFGGKHLARIFGMVMLIAQVIGGGAPVLMGIVHDRTGGYEPVLLPFAGLLTLGMIILFLLGRGVPRADKVEIPQH